MRAREVGSVAILDLSGKLSGDWTVKLEDKIDDVVKDGHDQVLLNLKKVSYIDSAGLGTLLAKRASVQKQGGALKLVHLTSTVRDLLSVTKLATVFDTFESEEEALESFVGRPPEPVTQSSPESRTLELDSSVLVLLVADRPDQPGRLCTLLDHSSSTSYNVTVARSTAEARGQLATARFDVLLLDLPDDTGLANFWALRRNSEDTPIVVLAAGQHQHLAHDAMQHGAQDFLDKDTVTLELLERTLRYAQDRHDWQSKQAKLVEHELEVAALLQERFLPREVPVVHGFDIRGHLHASGQIGGDFYDFIEIPGPSRQLAVAVGDASGKGIPGALLMAKAQGLLRAETSQEGTSEDVFRRVNRLLCHDAVQDRFVTLFCALLADNSREIRFVNAGHPRALLIQQDGIQTLSASGPPLGLFPDATYEEQRVTVNRDDLLVIYSDGITEAQDANDAFFDETGILDIVSRHPDSEPIELAQAICGAAEAFERGNQSAGDDKTVVVVQVGGGHETLTGEPAGTRP